MAYSTIRKGVVSDDVKTWQDFLKGQGYNISVDGNFGDETDKYTRDWQSNNGLTADGIVGKNTWASMNTTNNANTNTATQTTNNIPEIFGADKSMVEEGLSTFEGSDKFKESQANTAARAEEAQNFLSNKDIVSQDIKDKANSQLSDYLSPEIAQADSYIKEQLALIQGNKTSWTDQLNSARNDYLNRDPFEYDVDNDQLFQQALASAMNSGKTAMQDTIGQASALTGGYGSTYATTAGNQAYNQLIEDAYNNLPEYYQMAMEAYQMEGQEMLNRINILDAADNKEFSRWVDSYNLTSDYRNNLWNEGFNEWTTTTSNAINYGNFLLNENQTTSNNLKNAYDIAANETNTLYTQEWNDWNRKIENVWNVINYQNSDAWQTKNFNESVRQADREFYANYTSDGNGGYVAKSSSSSSKLSNGASASSMATYKQKALEAYNTGGNDAVDAYIDSLGINDDERTEIGRYLYGYKDDETGKEVKGYGVLPLQYQTFTKTKETVNGFWGVDNNDEVTDGNGKTWKLSELKKALKEDGVDTKTVNKILEELTSLSKDKSYTYSSK